MQPRRSTHRRPAHLLAALVVGTSVALLAAGCGSSDDGGSSKSSTATSGSTKAAATTETSTDSGSGSSSSSTKDVVVVPGASIGGVKVGDTKAAAEAALGEPKSDKPVDGELQGQAGTRLVYETPAVEVLLGEGGVLQMTTTDASAKTSDGVGIGSTLAQVKAAFPTASCDTGDQQICRIGGNDGGTVVTDFLVDGGKVASITVGTIVD